MKPIAIAALPGLLLAAACGGSDGPVENTASALEEAAEYSTPQAANVLDNAAEQVREQNIADPAAAQRALQAAGNAQSPAPPASGNSH